MLIAFVRFFFCAGFILSMIHRCGFPVRLAGSLFYTAALHVIVFIWLLITIQVNLCS